MRACERSEGHIKHTRRSLLLVAKDCGFGRLRDLDRTAVERWLLKQAKTEMSARRRNSYRLTFFTGY